MYVQKYNDTVIDRVTPFYLLLYSTTLRTLLISTKQALRENDALKFCNLLHVSVKAQVLRIKRCQTQLSNIDWKSMA